MQGIQCPSSACGIADDGETNSIHLPAIYFCCKTAESFWTSIQGNKSAQSASLPCAAQRRSLLHLLYELLQRLNQRGVFEAVLPRFCESPDAAGRLLDAFGVVRWHELQEFRNKAVFFLLLRRFRRLDLSIGEFIEALKEPILVLAVCVRRSSIVFSNSESVNHSRAPDVTDESRKRLIWTSSKDSSEADAELPADPAWTRIRCEATVALPASRRPSAAGPARGSCSARRVLRKSCLGAALQCAEVLLRRPPAIPLDVG